MKAMSKVCMLLSIMINMLSLYGMEEVGAVELNSYNHVPMIVNIVNDTGKPLYVRLRGGADATIQVLMPEYAAGSLNALMINNETFCFPINTVFSLDISQLVFPLRLRLWPITYVPSEDKAADKSTMTSEANKKNSLHWKLIYQKDIPFGCTSLILKRKDRRITSQWSVGYNISNYQYAGSLVSGLYDMSLTD